jgi:hypothetical protein
MAGYSLGEREPEPRIIRSRARCLDCGDVVESRHRHDFVGCSCGAMFLDGGLDYVRYGCKDFDRVELLTEYEATP